jgi:simple sugar transport system permease protein
MTTVKRADERVRQRSFVQRTLIRPETGAIIAAAIAFLIFAVLGGSRGFLTMAGAATWLEIAAQVGILGVTVTLLMIAGEFDLSIGSMIGAAGMIIALGLTEFALSPAVAIAVAFVVAIAIGYFNGWLVTKTGLPSFIVTLGMLFLIRGVTIGITRIATGRTQVGGLGEHIEDDPFVWLFAGDIEILGVDFAMSILWWVGLTILATYVLLRTTFGNWITGTGGNVTAARNVGVPVRRVKIVLFMATAASAALLATIQVLTVRSADVSRGDGKELEAIITAVIGGTLLTGGYGSPIGAFFGALTLGITKQGIFFAGYGGEWYLGVLGVALLAAVLLSSYIRKRATGVRG